MKLTSLFVFSLITTSSFHTSGASGNESRFTPNTIINLLFEMLRGLILIGDEKKNFPKTDPFVFDIDKFTMDGLIIRGELNATNGVLTGLGRFQLESFEFSPDNLSMTVDITIPSLKLEADYYELDGNIFGALPFAGIGIFYVMAEDITLNTKVYFKQSDDGKSVLIDRLENTSFTIAQMVSLTEYDKNIDHIINAIIADTFPSKLTRFSKYICGTYQDYVVAALNPMLGAYDTWSTLATIL